ncbi:starch synthase [Paenibacillus shirakamiensis]|uniref:Glycogen synthase n=1 Tax=Paenibacillus shirakamiensis TaxID=1265935 RepID=A0ABS4JDM9_9BACL|nr:glycogen synthase GlgA [Paenibacillus shirakamiensis]MBP1999835.1 starch synthase [Paenibacillus shirakamiensis]
MKILFAAAEAIPFIKTGGLADVIGALPKALLKAGHDVRIVIPKYKMIPESFKNQLKPVDIIQVPLGWRSQYCGIEVLTYEGIPVYFVDNEYYFGRDGIYGYGDDAERFAFLNRAVLEMLPYINFQPDVIHCHDWHTSLIPVLMKHHYLHNPFYQSIRTVFTVHNLLYQGIFPYEVLHSILDLPDYYFTPERLEYYGNVNYLKAGLIFADHVTTVSPTYSEEIKTDHYGYGLDGLLRSLGNKLSGIVNGIDTKLYNPATDIDIPAKYRTSLTKKRENKLELQRELGLKVSEKTPLISMVTRLVESKGLDLVMRVLDELLYYDDVQVVILGTGESSYEHWFREAAYRHPGKLSVQIKFNDGLSRRIYAGSDLFLMPSQFEPCGISQLLALRYGTIPVVRETGGLNDTVQSYNEFTGEGNGFTFHDYNAHDMLYTIRRAIHFYLQPPHWKKVARNAFGGEYSWNVSAEQYLDIYRQIQTY